MVEHIKKYKFSVDRSDVSTSKGNSINTIPSKVVVGCGISRISG